MVNKVNPVFLDAKKCMVGMGCHFAFMIRSVFNRRKRSRHILFKFDSMARAMLTEESMMQVLFSIGLVLSILWPIRSQGKEYFQLEKNIFRFYLFIDL
jgi:hypothetical protein